MFNRKDPLIDSVKNVMKENELRREAERKLCEELGIASRKQLPREHLANYDALLEQKIAEALHPNQQKLDVHEPEKDKLTAQDFKMLRAKNKPMKEEDDKSVQGSGAVTKDGKDVVSSTAPKAEGPTDKERAALTNKVKEVMKEEQVDEASYSAKEARAGKDIGKPGKMFKKIASDAAKRYGSKERGKKVAGAVLAKLRSKTMEEDVEQIEEKAPPGAKFERMVKHIKKKYAKDGLTKQEKSIAYATAWKAKNKEEMKEEVLAELKKNLGEDKLNEFLEKLGFAMGNKQSEPLKDLSGNIAGGGNVGGKGAPETTAPKAAPAPQPAKEPLKDLSGGGDIAGGGNVGGQGAPETTAPKPAASTPAPEKPEASGRENVRSSNQPTSIAGGRGTTVEKPGARAASMAPKAAPRPAAPKPAAPAPAAKPATQEPISGPDDQTSPLAALRQYQASKEAGNFDNKPVASAARPAARSMPAKNVPMPPRRPAGLSESLEQTIKKIIEE